MNKKIEIEKFPEEQRNFETRIRFIHDIFTNKYKPCEIMAHCVKYKLGVSFENYERDLHTSVWNLQGEDPIKILKKIDK